MIIKTSDGRLFRVTETSDPDLAHVWMGHQVVRCTVPDDASETTHYVRRRDAREILVRKAGSVVIEEG